MNARTAHNADAPLFIINDGPLIRETNFWETEYERRGLFYISTNGGAVRILVPDAQRGTISEMERGTQHVIFSYLKQHLVAQDQLALEVLFEDGSNSPYALHSAPGAFDRYPAQQDSQSTWRATVWEQCDGKPKMRLDLPAYVRTVYQIPCLQPWQSPFPSVFGVSAEF